LLIDRAGFFERINQGGLVGYVILIILGLGIFMGAIQFQFLFKESKLIESELQTGKFSNDSILGKLNNIYAAYKGENPEELEARLEDVLAKASPPLEKNLSIIKLLAAVAPLLGLLGTVIGMIKAFNVISLSGTGNPGLVASGISEALITTAAGMLVGIPALVLYHYFRGKIDRYVFEMEEVAIQLVEELSYDGVVKEKGSVSQRKQPPISNPKKYG
jgi:biopolymer transport protein ExbB